MANWQAVARQAAQSAGIDPNVFIRQINQESGGRDVSSLAGAQGPGQFMPGTARSVGLNSTTVHQLVPSLNAAARLMAGYVKRFGSYRNALIAYNAGPNAVGGSLPAETQNYLKIILGAGGGSGSTRPAAVTPGAMGGTASSDPSSSLGAQPQIMDAGQGSDFTSLLQSLLSKPQPAQGSVTPINAPAFAAAPRMPTGFHPLNAASVPVQQPQSGVSDALSLVGALGGSTPSLGSPGVSQAGSVPGTGPGAPAAAAPARGGASGGSGRYPVAKLGKIIGTPYQGTHTLGNWQSDNAVDIAVPIGTPMVALQDGVVVKVTRHPQGAAGSRGTRSRSAARTATSTSTRTAVSDVQAGQKVRKGQELGTTGSANGVAHLHFGQMRGDPRSHAR
jgi:hypothetical protein